MFQLNGKKQVMDISPKIIKGEVMIPLRFISEILEANISWNESLRTIRINLKERKNLISNSKYKTYLI